MSSSKLLKKLEAALDAQTQVIVRLEAKIVALEAEIVILKTKKNSNNSHTPPSSDPNRPKTNQSLRVKTGLAVGGQPGHEGRTLECRTAVDEVIKHSPGFCACCGNDLAAVTGTLVTSRQVLDILPVVLQCYEHQTYKKKCGCGHIAEGSFPGYVSAAVQYGPNTEALVGYLHTRQYIPYQRMKEFLNDVMKLPVSTGGIHNILQRLAQKATPVYGAIKARIEQAAVVGADETSLNINGRLHWMWAWQNEKLTYLVASANRAFKTIKDTFVNGLPKAAVNHDRYAAHFKMDARQHQMCTAHLLRDLTYLGELYNTECSWAKEFKQLLLDATALKKQLTVAQYYHSDQRRDDLFKQLDYLLRHPIDDSHAKAKALQKKLLSQKDAILYFLLEPDVPPDNNGSERAIRNVKVKQKISGQYKSMDGAEMFAILRSVIDTAIKSGQNALQALLVIALKETE